MGKTLQYDGHYGTTRYEANEIVQKNEIPMTATGEHGRGIYLIESNVDYVLDILKSKMVKSNRALIYACVTADEDTTLDLRFKHSIGTQMLQQAHNELVEAITNEKVAVNAIRPNKHVFLISELCSRYKFQLIRSNITTGTKVVAIKLCAREPSIISNISDVSLAYII